MDPHGHLEKSCVAGGVRSAYLPSGQMHHKGNADDDEADDDGGDGHPFRIPPQPPGSFIVSIIVAVQRLGDRKEKPVTPDNPQGKAQAFSGCLIRKDC